MGPHADPMGYHGASWGSDGNLETRQDSVDLDGEEDVHAALLAASRLADDQVTKALIQT